MVSVEHYTGALWDPMCPMLGTLPSNFTKLPLVLALCVVEGQQPRWVPPCSRAEEAEEEARQRSQTVLGPS
ncbi:hypothetical protein HaLaN_22456 [Haematococcus lacustris]|uniref:Uncharacterized protein n=1 Tax=Haematococcus lacustris TaxID=44745 RepID=A0A699ZP72_HAELA|nr:hypothetical protein HaLaN_22456 [Haematococcus lacustris]